ncbi:hypothetical protein NSA31_15400 [Bacillus subtilis]|nr:hypothetical protein [Bacillus subtilis]
MMQRIMKLTTVKLAALVFLVGALSLPVCSGCYRIPSYIHS